MYIPRRTTGQAHRGKFEFGRADPLGWRTGAFWIKQYGLGDFCMGRKSGRENRQVPMSLNTFSKTWRLLLAMIHSTSLDHFNSAPLYNTLIACGAFSAQSYITTNYRLHAVDIAPETAMSGKKLSDKVRPEPSAGPYLLGSGVAFRHAFESDWARHLYVKPQVHVPKCRSNESVQKSN